MWGRPQVWTAVALTLIPVHSGLAFSILYGLVKAESDTWVERTSMATNGSDITVTKTIARSDSLSDGAADDESLEVLHTSTVFNFHPFWQSSVKSVNDGEKTRRTTRKSIFYIRIFKKEEVVNE